jgi:hypothetical protein
MTRWVAQTRENYVSVTPYNYTDTKIHGFQGTHQPAIWMGESAQVVVVPGAGTVQRTTLHVAGCASATTTSSRRRAITACAWMRLKEAPSLQSRVPVRSYPTFF